MGLDVQALDSIQHDILTLYKPPAVQTVGADGMPSHEAIGDSIAGLCSVSIVSALYKATGQLLDDLNRNVRLLSTPERCVPCPTFPGCSPASGLVPYQACHRSASLHMLSGSAACIFPGVCYMGVALTGPCLPVCDSKNRLHVPLRHGREVWGNTGGSAIQDRCCRQ